MNNIKTYNFCNALSTYTLGNVYSFYLRNNNIPNLVKLKQKDASQEDIKQYKKALRTVVRKNPQVKTSTGKYSQDYTRAIGVVIDTYKTSCPTGIDTITVMFRTTDKKFVLNKYAVGNQELNHTWTSDVVPAAAINLATA